MEGFEGTLRALIISRLIGERSRDPGAQIFEQRQHIGWTAEHEALRPGGQASLWIRILHCRERSKVGPFFVRVSEGG